MVRAKSQKRNNRDYERDITEWQNRECHRLWSVARGMRSAVG
jgi:hypothetical protein